MVCEPLISQKNNCTKVYCSHMKGIFMNLLNLLIYLGSEYISGAFKSLCGSKHFTACLGRREKLAKIHTFLGQTRSCTGLQLVFPPTRSVKIQEGPKHCCSTQDRPGGNSWKMALWPHQPRQQRPPTSSHGLRMGTPELGQTCPGPDWAFTPDLGPSPLTRAQGRTKERPLLLFLLSRPSGAHSRGVMEECPGGPGLLSRKGRLFKGTFATMASEPPVPFLSGPQFSLRLLFPSSILPSPSQEVTHRPGSPIRLLNPGPES